MAHKETLSEEAPPLHFRNDLDIRLIIMDVDGVLTDGGIIINDDGTESKRFNVRDGAWLRIWHRLGRQSAILSGRYCRAVEHRARQLEISYVYQDAHQKLEVFQKLLAESGIEPRHIAYIGDDAMDLPVMRRVRFPVAVADAISEVRRLAVYITESRGGQGAVYELIRTLLKEMGLWEQAMQRYHLT